MLNSDKIQNDPVVITGIGLVTPLGLGRQRNWERLIAGGSAVEFSKEYGFLCAKADFISGANHMRPLQMGFLAMLEAIEDSKLDIASFDPQRVGMTVSVSKQILVDGPAISCLPEAQIDDYNYHSNGNLNFPGFLYQSALGNQLAKVFKIRGPRQNIVAACATGTDSCILAAQWIKWGLCDVVICGASESSFHPLYLAGFNNMGVLAKNIVSPFSADREGFAISEGAGILVLERKSGAVMRSAKIYAHMLGWSLSADAGGMVAMNESGKSVSGAISQALKMAGIEYPDYINAHGTATKMNDKVESTAIKNALKKNAYKTSISSIKAATGHMLGACGAVELGITALALEHKIMPPTLNLTNADPELDLDYVPNAARKKEINSAMSLSLGFGGQIGAVVLC